jgi:hypothetical protein
MIQVAFNKPQNNHDSTCGDSLTMAERELGAFFGAVTELFGSEQAKISAADWIHELMAVNVLPSSVRQWRLLTIKVLSRLASRIGVSSKSTASRTLAYSDQSGACSTR